MLYQGLLLDGIADNALVSARETGALQQRALERLEAMQHRGLQPDGITYSAKISARARGTLPREPCSSPKQFCTKASCQT